MGSCAAPSAKGDDKFITTDYLQQCRYDHLKDFPAGCSELASQTLTDYLTEDGSNLYSCIVGMQWDNG
ncbi:hypothetical protein INQ71_25670, partial [Escherichia coli]|nr:hypothetical protein [Escherichia coli]